MRALVVALLLVAVGVGAFFIGRTTAPSSENASRAGSELDPAVAAGAHLFVQFACFACHGERGRGGVSPQVPALDQAGPALTAQQLRHIIDNGLGVSGDPNNIYMPVWGPVISKRQVDYLIAYLHAGLPEVPGAVPPPIPRDSGPVVAGAALYERYGCINCHGPNGLGGVPNPASPDKTIPSLTGKFFREDFTTADVIDIIRTGSVIGQPPIASMPHWGGIIANDDLKALAAYLKTLK